jgi:hypothetical protein
MPKNKKYETVIRGKWVYGNAKTFDEMIVALQSEIKNLEDMRDSGCELCSDGAQDDYFFVFSGDKKIASKFGMEVIK